MKKELLMLKRKKAKELYEEGLSKREIACRLFASKKSVLNWIQLSEKEVILDGRGWKKGIPRKYTQKAKEEIIKIRKNLEKEDSYFFGSEVVKANYENKEKQKISKSFVNRTLKEANLVKRHGKKKKGGSKYMKYPQRTLSKLGKSMMSIDFIGPRYLKGSSDRINFLSCKYIRPTKEGIVKRIDGQTTEQTIKILKEVWKTNIVPSVLKVDNDSAFGAHSTHKMCIGKLTLFLLNLGVSPLYIAPRSPWNNGQVEGFNSVFSKKFWNKLQFTDEDELDIKIKDFNVAYEKYSKLIFNNPEVVDKKYIDDFKNVDLENKNVKEFKVYEIYFLRVVRRKGEKDGGDEIGFVNVLGREIRLRKDLINLFVFCTLDLKSSKLVMETELDDGLLKKIKSVKFVVENVKY